MPANRTPKKDRNTTPKKKQEKKKEVTSSPSKSALLKTWNEALKPWVRDSTRPFTHPTRVRTITKTNALKWYKPLKDTDLSTLPYEERTNPHSASHPMRLYSENDVARLARQKREHLGLPPDTNDPSSGGVYLIQYTPQQVEAMLTPRDKSVLKHYDPDPKPRILRDYTPVPSDPPSDQIIWGGCKRVPPNVQASDACLLFNITREDIQDLTDVSQWVDTRSVAMRAVQLHGGLKAHNDLIDTKREEEISELERQHLLESRNHFSRDLQCVLEPDPDEWMYEIRSRPPHSCNANCVAQYFPPVFGDMDDYGCGGSWL